MKLKVIKREFREVETNLELPVYLCFQDEFNNDELVKITEKERITVKYEYAKLNISVEYYFKVENINFERVQTTEKHFNEVYKEAIEQLNKSFKQ